MDHEEYVRIVPGADTAVLFIHGIVGTPNHFRDQIPLVQKVPEDRSVYNLLLDGHGRNVEDFAASSMKKWREQVRAAFLLLAEKHERVIIVGHSMGTLFAMQLGVEFPEKIPFLFLLAAPMRPWICPRMIRNLVLLVYGDLEHAEPSRAALAKAAGVTTTRRIWKYFPWAPRFAELLLEIHRTEKILGSLRVPCFAYQSRKDELVRFGTGKVLERYGVAVQDLPASTHYYYAPADRERICADFARRIKNRTHD